MQTKLDIGPFERPVACVWVPTRLEQRAVTCPVTSPQKPKPEFETIPTESSRLGCTCLGTAELTQESPYSLRNVERRPVLNPSRQKRVHNTHTTRGGVGTGEAQTDLISVVEAVGVKRDKP